MIDFTHLINSWRDGALVMETNEALEKLIKDCIDTGKEGQFTLSFKLKPFEDKSGGHQISVVPKVESKNPRFENGVGYFHVVTDEKGNPVDLQREDPRQSALFDQVNGIRKEVA